MVDWLIPEKGFEPNAYFRWGCGVFVGDDPILRGFSRGKAQSHKKKYIGASLLFFWEHFFFNFIPIWDFFSFFFFKINTVGIYSHRKRK